MIRAGATPAAPFFYGDPYTISPRESRHRTHGHALELLEHLSAPGIVVQNRSAITNLSSTRRVTTASLRGSMAWKSDVSMRLPISSTTPFRPRRPPSQTIPAWLITRLTLASTAVGALVNGTNILAIQAFNDNLTNSTDFAFNAQLYSFVPDFGVVPPRLAFADPAAGDIFYLTNLTITFSEPVTNVDAADLLVNGVPASGVRHGTNMTYTFSFPQPSYGNVLVTWATDDNILISIPRPSRSMAWSTSVDVALHADQSQRAHHRRSDSDGQHHDHGAYVDCGDLQ